MTTDDPGTFHRDKANDYLRGTHGSVTVIHATAATAEATLALAAEQRTANLIAHAALSLAVAQTSITLGIEPDDEMEAAGGLILKRLGL